MLKDVTLGQYFPGDTFVHRLDPRTKLVSVVLYFVALFSANGIISVPLVIVTLMTCVAVSRIKPRAMLKGMKPLLFIVIFTAILNLFYTEGHVILQWWIFRVTEEGVRRTVLMVVRIALLVSCTFLLTYTTSPLQLTDGLEQLFRPLKKIGFPVHEMAMMMSIALRFIPTLIEETDKIMSAQKARGAEFDTGNLIQKAKAMLPLLVPLFISAFRRADELATAMESRCYHGGEGRTKMKVLKMARRDWIALGCGAVLLALTILLRRLGL